MWKSLRWIGLVPSLLLAWAVALPPSKADPASNSKNLTLECQLLNGANQGEAHLGTIGRCYNWGSRLGRPLRRRAGRYFDLQDRVTASVVGTIEPKLRQAEIERSKRKRTESLDAYDAFLRGVAHYHVVNESSYTQAFEYLKTAIL